MVDSQPLLSQTGVNAESFSSLAETLIPCPQKRGWIDKDRGYQVRINQADSEVCRGITTSQ
jgi:hypothetical protein